MPEPSAAPWDTRAVNMGGPGDHWYTDLVSWDRPAFGEPSDSLLKEIGRLGGHRLLADDQPLGRRLWELWPQWGRVDVRALAALAADLTIIRDQLRAQAQESGWEIE